MAVTSIQSLKKYAEGSEVELSGFVNGETITVDGGMTKRMIYDGDEGWSYAGR